MLVVCPKCGVYHEGDRDGDPCLRCADLVELCRLGRRRCRQKPPPRSPKKARPTPTEERHDD